MAYVRAIMSLVQSSHSALDTLVLFDVATYRRCPTVTSIRALYALHEIFTVWKSVYHQQGYLSEVVNEEVLALEFYAKQTEEFFKQAIGVEGFTIPQMALNALPNVLLSMQDMEARKRQHQAQQRQPEPPPGPADRRAGAIRAPSSIISDLEVILIIDLGDTIRAPPENRDPDQDQDDTGLGVAPDWPATVTANDDFHVSLDDTLLDCELETMTVPDSAIDPGWLISG